LFRFKMEFAGVLKRDDIILIENSPNKDDLEIQLKSYQGQFDRVVVSTHGSGGINSIIPTMGFVGDDYLPIPITDVIEILNKGNEATLEKIHLTSCFIGSNFDKVKRPSSSPGASNEFTEELDKVLSDGQMVYFHGDNFVGDLIQSLGKRLEGIVGLSNKNSQRDFFVN